MGNKLSPENIKIIPVENKIEMEQEENPVEVKNKQSIMFIDEEYDYGQYYSLTEDTTGNNSGNRRRNAIHPHLLDIVQSQYTVIQEKFKNNTNTEQ